jgi:hypothetical protein
VLNVGWWEGFCFLDLDLFWAEFSRRRRGSPLPAAGPTLTERSRIPV